MAPNEATPIPLTAELLKRLAGVLSAWPESGNFYLVMSSDGKGESFFPDDRNPRCFADGEQKEMDTALADMRKTGAKAQVLGPFRTTFSEADRGGFDVTVKVTTTKNGNSKTYDLEGVDLICWTPAAFDKFVAPFYLDLHGNGPAAFRFVAALKKKMLHSASGVMAHYWPTFPGTLESYDVVGEAAPAQEK